jgi:hypothetical protein
MPIDLCAGLPCPESKVEQASPFVPFALEIFEDRLSESISPRFEEFPANPLLPRLKGANGADVPISKKMLPVLQQPIPVENPAGDTQLPAVQNIPLSPPGVMIEILLAETLLDPFRVEKLLPAVERLGRRIDSTAFKLLFLETGLERQIPPLSEDPLSASPRLLLQVKDDVCVEAPVLECVQKTGLVLPKTEMVSPPNQQRLPVPVSHHLLHQGIISGFSLGKTFERPPRQKHADPVGKGSCSSRPFFTGLLMSPFPEAKGPCL